MYISYGPIYCNKKATPLVISGVIWAYIYCDTISQLLRLFKDKTHLHPASGPEVQLLKSQDHNLFLRNTHSESVL